MSTKTKSKASAIVQQSAAQLDGLSYGQLLSELKAEIARARVRAALAVNRELVLLYWSIGKRILKAQAEQGWGAKVIDQISADLRAEFPDMTGISARNLKYMRKLAEAWPDEQIVQSVIAQIPWGHNTRILDGAKDKDERLWYIQKAFENGWSQRVLVHQIESELYRRQGKLVSNFERTLPPPQSDLVREIFKDPYNFEFLNLSEEFSERELEKTLVARVRDFLLEMGKGFALVGSQYHLEIGGDDFYLDLLFYHLSLRSFVIVDLKTDRFKPEYAGKMNFYLSAVDDLLKHKSDHPSIGLILCKEKNRVIAEYALRDINKPMGIAEYRTTREMPKELRDVLPKLEDIEAKLTDPGE